MSRDSAAADELGVHESRLRAAMLSGDVAALDALLADDLIFTDQAGRVLTKAMDLDVHRSGRLRLASLEFSDVLTRRASDAMIVVLRAAVAGTYGGTPFAGAYRYTRIWRPSASGWQVAAAHCSAIE